MADSIKDLNDFLFFKNGLIKVKNIKETETFILLSSQTKFFKLS
jgi:hypothetical protein